MEIIKCRQGTPEWFEARAGKITASNFDKILTPTGKLSSQAEKYLYQVAGEAVLGTCEESYTSTWMQRGSDLEVEARQFFELATGLSVEQVGFVSDGGIGCSPDGLIGEDGGLEIKCPRLSNHVGYVLKGELPPEYKPQVQGSLLVTGRKFWYFMSYFPGMEPLILKVERDEKYIQALARALKEAVETVKEITLKLKGGQKWMN